MRNFKHEILANTAFQMEYFTNMRNLRDELQKSGDIDGAVRITEIGIRAKEYIDKYHGF